MGKVHVDWLCRMYQYQINKEIHEIAVTPWRIAHILDEQDEKMEKEEAKLKGSKV